MRIAFIELANFRRLRCIRVGLANDKTVFVGANNSGKTSMMVALRRFLLARERKRFSLNDFTLSHWPAIDAMAREWEKAQSEEKEIPKPKLEPFLPFLDLWLHVEPGEEHYVQKIIPTLEWSAGLLGLRLRLEPTDLDKLQMDYLAARAAAKTAQSGGADKAPNKEAGAIAEVSLWPESFTKFLERSLGAYFTIRPYILDPAKCCDPDAGGEAKPQELGTDLTPIDGDPLRGLIRIDEITAQRGFGAADVEEDDDDVEGFASASAGSRKLSDQLRRYYKRHLDPAQTPDAEDIAALRAIEEAQRAFDLRLKEGFEAALGELEQLGYPGFSDPRLKIATRLKPVDGLSHDSAVQYVVRMGEGEAAVDLNLPEDSNGLGYQNLISMVFRLMSFRDAWMRVRKAQSRMASSEQFIPPLHVVLIEEPEAHLHTQVQQVFTREAYSILRNHPELGEKKTLTTQMVVSTHSSHIAHECDFSSLRYFRRLPPKVADIPTSCVVNLTKVFGEDDETQRFVTRYLKVTHCDLFFADAAILIEGPAERILVPHLVRCQDKYKDLRESYVTWLEITGSHAHRMRMLIEHLGLITLIITDLDAMGEDQKKVAPARASGQKTRNATLKTWHPGTDELDRLLDLPAKDKVKEYETERFAIRVAYQKPVQVSYKEHPATEALANTLEDALVIQNLNLFAKLDGTGLIAKFKQAIAESATIGDLSKALSEILRGDAPKAEFALDLLEVDPKSISAPEYIDEGLVWLAAELRKKSKDLGLPISAVALAEAAQ